MLHRSDNYRDCCLPDVVLNKFLLIYASRSLFVTTHYPVNRFTPHLVFLWVMGYMTACHGWRMYVGYMSGTFDFTAMQMVLVMKLTSFAFNVYDGKGDQLTSDLYFCCLLPFACFTFLLHLCCIDEPTTNCKHKVM